MKKPTLTVDAAGKPEKFKDNEFVTKYPTIVEYLTDEAWEDGSTRETSTLSLFVEEGYWKAALNDKALKRSCYTTAGTVKELFAAIEKAIKADGCDWRAWNAKKGKK